MDVILLKIWLWIKLRGLLILNIFAILFALSFFILHFTGVVEMETKTLSKAGIIFITYFLGVLNYYRKTKASVPKTTQYAELYKHIIRDAFANDKTGYRKLMQGITYFNNDQYDKAISHLTKLEKRCMTSRDTSAVLFFIAKSYKDKGQTSMAIETYEQLLKIDASCSSAWSNLGLIHHEAGRVSDAKYALKQALLYNPENPFAHVNLANVLYKNGEFEEAKNLGLKAFQLNNQLPAAASITALCYASLGDAENAKKFCQIYGTTENNKDLIAMVEQQLKMNEILKDAAK
ncbi:MAG: tetratricopeptide repeat protein [Lachnospiraceae bacterium]|nr:tetratricopeptide repeat protein [Lachnospiraceae bacterium]